jgi:hypothetical protein
MFRKEEGIEKSSDRLQREITQRQRKAAHEHRHTQLLWLEGVRVYFLNREL